MNAAGFAVAATASETQSAARSLGCFHCGEALGGQAERAIHAGTTRDFCCAGCAAAAQWIESANLGEFYRLRSDASPRVGVEKFDASLWDRDEVLRSHAHAVAGGLEITFLVEGMRCAACAWLIDRALHRQTGVLAVSANAVTGRVRLTWSPQQVVLSRLIERLASLGYRPCLAAGESRERERRQLRNRWLLRIALAGLGAMQAMMFAEAGWFNADSMTLATRDFFRWMTFIVATPVVFYCGWPFLAGLIREVRLRRFGMDTLAATSIVLAWLASTVETLRGGPHVWYDAAAMFVLLLLTARMLEWRTREIANARVDALAGARPLFATRERADGSRESIAVTALVVADVVRVADGEIVPADGVLLDAQCHFEEALLTGEFAAVEREVDGPVLAGTICRGGSARIRLTAVGSATRLSQIVRLVEHAQAHRPALQRAAEQIASRFVVGMLLLTALVYLFWQVHDPSRAIEVSLSLLVISCPCALSLSVPAALAAAQGALARIGVLSLQPDAIERLARITDLVFDKTGTLTDAQPRVDRVECLNPQLTRETALSIAAALERDNTHPLAAAFAAFDDHRAAMPARNLAGSGVEGFVDGRQWRLGRASFAAGRADDDGIWLGDGATAVARFTVSEQLRSDAVQAIEALREDGITLHLLSGDDLKSVERVAQQLQIDAIHARQTPESKLDFLHKLRSGRGHFVGMVGDGLNDAPVLAGADVSIAVEGAAALARRSADLALNGSRLAAIPQALNIARRTRRIIHQNLGWALGYNLLALPIAAMGLVTPWLAALGMTLSSLLVTLNALRLTRRTAS